MCEPVSIGMAAAAVGTGVSAIGQLKQGQAEQRASYENANNLELQAAQRQEKADYDIASLKRSFGRDQGNKIAKIAGDGLNLQTFADVLLDDALESFQERKAVQYSANIDKANIRADAAAQRRSGDDARTGSYYAAAGTVLSGVSKGVEMKSRFDTSSPSNSSATASLK
jgi:hypothetical protein